MKNLMFVLMFCYAKLVAEEINGVHYSLESDTPWKVSESYKTDGQELISYLLEGEDPTNWTELFTVQTVKDFNKNPSEFFKLFVEQLQILAPGKNVQTKILKDEGTDFLAEWWINDKSSQDQHEWLRLVDKKGDLVILRYTTKKTDQMETAQKKAEKMLK